MARMRDIFELVFLGADCYATIKKCAVIKKAPEKDFKDGQRVPGWTK